MQRPRGQRDAHGQWGSASTTAVLSRTPDRNVAVGPEAPPCPASLGTPAPEGRR